MLCYFHDIVHFHYLLQQVPHIWYQKTFLGSLGGFFVNLFSFAVLPTIVIIAVVFVLYVGIIHLGQGLNPILLTVGSTWEYPYNSL